MNPNCVYIVRPAPVRRSLKCGYCRATFPAGEYMDHVKECLVLQMRTWNSEEYSKTYYAQVRAISRFKQPGDPRRRNKYRSWAWWAVHQNGPALVQAEVT